MSPSKISAAGHKESQAPSTEMPRPGGGCKTQLTDMDTVQEELPGDSSDESTQSEDLVMLRTRAMQCGGGCGAGAGAGAEAPLMSCHSQPPSRRVSTDFDSKNLNTRRPSVIIAAFRRPSQALALCAATQRRFLSEVLPRSSRASNGSAHRDAVTLTRADILGQEDLSRALSALYAKLLVVLGLAFPVTEAITKSNFYYQGFSCYLYAGSVLFVVFLYATRLRQRTVSSIMTTYADHAFGIGSMVYSGLEFGGYFDKLARGRSPLAAVTPAVRMLLTLLQMQFIFLNSEDIEASRHKTLQRFGLMHMIATNLCEWLYVVVAETDHEFHHVKHDRDNNATSGASSMMDTLLQNCSPFLFPCTIEYSLICAVIIYEMWKEVHCTPEDIEKKLNPHHHNKSSASRQNSVTPEKILQQFAGMLGLGGTGGAAARHHFSVDCSHAHRGVFGGILLVVGTIISLIMFFVLASDKMDTERLETAIFEVNICELTLYSVTLVAVVVAHLQMRALNYKRKPGAVLSLDTSLLMLAQSGMFIYCMFSLIGCYHTLYSEDGSGLTGFFSELLGLLQTILQTLFIIDSWWRRCSTSEHRTSKPGRQLVTFLLVANMAMWIVNTLEKNRAEFRPAHLKFYGRLAWTIITHVSMPLAIFYRFHSTICLFEIWKNSFKSKPIYINI